MSQHLLGIRHLERSQIDELISLSAEFKQRSESKKPLPTLEGKTAGLLFFGGSTRTRVSFEQAAYGLGLRVVNFSDTPERMRENDETLKDMIVTLRQAKLDTLVIKHYAAGVPILAKRHFQGPVINAGDGAHEHPTQALTDALTIIEKKGKLKGLVVAIVGDVDNSRVARSNAWLLSKMGAEVRLVGPRTLMPCHTGKLPGTLYYDLESGIEQADVILCLRMQKARMKDGMLGSLREYAQFYQVNRHNIRLAAKNCLVLHPGPIHRGLEVDDAVADSSYSGIQQQIENSIFVRMACFSWANQPIAAKELINL